MLFFCFLNEKISWREFHQIYMYVRYLYGVPHDTLWWISHGTFQWIGSLLPYRQTTRLDDHIELFLSNPVASLAIPQSSDSGWLILNDVSKEPREVLSPKLNWPETLVPDLSFTRLSSHALSSQHGTVYLGVSFRSSAGVALVFPSLSPVMDIPTVHLEKTPGNCVL